MSGGSGSLDAQYQPIPKQSPQQHNSGLYRPKRVEIDAEGKKKYVFACGRCGNEFRANRKRPRTFCGERCRRAALGELGTKKKGQKRTSQERKSIGEGQKRAWQDPNVRKARVQGMHRYPRGRDKKKRQSKKKKQHEHECAQCGKPFKNNH